MDYRPLKKDKSRGTTCLECKAVLAEFGRLGVLDMVPMHYMVREGSDVHILASDHSFLCGRGSHGRHKSKSRRRKMSLFVLLLIIGLLFGLGGLVTAAKWLLIIAVICWLVGFISYYSGSGPRRW